MEPITATTFRLGQSTVVTLPKKIGIKPGTKVTITKKAKGFTMTPEKTPTNIDTRTKKALEYVKKHAGCLKYKAKRPYPTLKEMSDAYEKDTYGDVFPGY